MDWQSVPRGLVGIALLAFLPGWVWTRALLPTLSRLETALVAIGLSVAMMVFVLYVGSAVFSIAVTATHAVWWALALMAAGWVVWVARRRTGAHPRS